MEKNRLEAFSDGVIAIIITIMVLELHTPEGASFKDLLSSWPTFLSYLLSFIYLGIYWVNHHRVFSNVEKVSTAVLWANLFFLFWLSLIPFSTTWMSNHFSEPFPTGFYGIILFIVSISFRVLEWTIAHKAVRTVNHSQFGANGLREQISSIVYLASWPLAYLSVWVSLAVLYVLAIWWIFPDRTAKEENS
jgi:uncharacterized membrane protein